MRLSPVLALALAAGIALAGLAGATGPVHAQPPYPPVPPPRYQAPPPPLGPHQAWVPGHWQWNGMRYVWIAPHAVHRGPHWHRWVPGHWAWAPRAHRWVWRPAHWA